MAGKKEGITGSRISLVDVSESEVAYLFIVSIPGVKKDQCKIKCEIERDGRVRIEGATNAAAEITKLPGPFSMTFLLPGPVDPRLFSPSFRPDDMLEVVVMKNRSP